MDIINELAPNFEEHMDVEQLLPYLIKYNVLARHEKQQLRLMEHTNCRKVQDLLSMLEQKNTKGQEDFIKALYESSQEQGSGGGHHKLIELLQNKGITIESITLHGK